MSQVTCGGLILKSGVLFITPTLWYRVAADCPTLFGVYDAAQGQVLHVSLNKSCSCCSSQCGIDMITPGRGPCLATRRAYDTVCHCWGRWLRLCSDGIQPQPRTPSRQRAFGLTPAVSVHLPGTNDWKLARGHAPCSVFCFPLLATRALILTRVDWYITGPQFIIF